MTTTRDSWRGRRAGPWLGALLLAAVPVAAQVANWPSERPPQPLPARDVNFPPYEVRTLANGLQVVAIAHHEQPAVSLRLLVRAGAALDPADRPGVAAMVGTLLDQGTTTRSAHEIADTVDSRGGALGTGAGTDLSYVNAVVLKPDFGFALELVADVARHPAFAPEEIERQRQQVLSGLRVAWEDPDNIARLVFDRLVFGAHPYGRPSTGTPQSIPQITRDDLLAFHRQYFTPNNSILAIVGDITAEEAFEGAERALGDWPRQEVPVVELPEPPPPTRRLVLIDRPGAVQTELRVGHLGIPRNHPDYMALNLAIRILGGEGSNRLHRVLRSERGLTYGASADLETLEQSGSIVADTDTRSDATAEVLRLTVEEFARLRRERVHPRELSEAQAYLAGNFPLTIETPGAIAMQVLNAIFYGLDLEELETFRERVNAVTVDDIQRVARTYLLPDRLSIVLVGDGSIFAGQLHGLGFDTVERVPLGELDLTAPGLRSGTGATPAGGAPRLPRNSIIKFSSGQPGGGPAHAPRPEPPEDSGSDPGQAEGTAREIIGQALEAKGGRERLQSIRTLRARASTTVQTPEGSVTAETVSYVRYPADFRVEVKLPAGEIVQVYAAGDAWIRDPRGVRDAPPPVRAEFEAGVRRDLVSLLLRAEAGDVRLRLLPDLRGEAGQRLRGVEVADPAGAPVRLYVDERTGMVDRLTYTVQGATGREAAEEHFSDYRDVDGVQVAFSARVRRAGTLALERTLRDFQFNVELAPELFRRPVR
jgi:zinc protease